MQLFLRTIWERITSKADRKVYHPQLVWQEIKSFIKGSLVALHSQDGFLSEEKYLEVGRKQAPNFSGDRKSIYGFFLAYNAIKKQERFYDEGDIVCSIFKRLKLHSAGADWTLHRLYVDETQDFTQAELAVLLRACADPNGLFLTGDTAQSIMRGVHFRFKDLQSIFHHAWAAARRQSGHTDLVKPTLHHLLYNYRSHAGILQLASSVIDLLHRFFPASFDDNLPRDQGMFDGPKPVLLDVCTDEGLRALVKGNDEGGSQSVIEFGAHQVSSWCTPVCRYLHVRP